MTYTVETHRPCLEASLRVFNRHMSRRSPTVAVVSADRRVGRALVAYLSSDGSAAAQVIGPYTYHAGQGQFRQAEAVVCDLDGCDLAVAFHLVERVAAAHIPVLVISASAAVRTQALARGAAACADKSAAALEELVRQLADALSATRTTRRADEATPGHMRALPGETSTGSAPVDR
jgi:CheY-like chemotaxis protein